MILATYWFSINRRVSGLAGAIRRTDRLFGLFGGRLIRQERNFEKIFLSLTLWIWIFSYWNRNGHRSYNVIEANFFNKCFFSTVSARCQLLKFQSEQP